MVQLFANNVTTLTVFLDSHFAEEGKVYFGKLEKLCHPRLTIVVWGPLRKVTGS
jgi:hypothetical protein